MRLELTGRHVDITPALRRLLDTKLSRLERLLNDSAVSAQAVLTREKRGSFPRKGSDWFYADEPSDKLWRDDLRLLSQQHRALRAAVASTSAQRLREMARIVHGAAFHDIYHAGQIQLIKKLQARKVNG